MIGPFTTLSRRNNLLGKSRCELLTRLRRGWTINLSRRAIITALGGVPFSLLAQDQNFAFTIGQLNGRVWVAWKEADRIMYAQAFSDGVTWLFGMLSSSVVKDVPHDSMSAVVYKYFVASKFTLGDQVKEVSKLYADNPANVILPIPEVMIAATLALNGIPSSEIAKRLEERRNYYINRR
jgi:hypothetical protein